MRDRKVAVRYARALLGVLPQGADRRGVDEFLNSLAAAMEASAEFRDTLLSPAVPRDVRKRILMELSQAQGMPAEVGRFLGVVIDNRRAGAIPAIAKTFHAVRERAEGVVPVTLTTAVPLAPEMQRRAVEAFERLTGQTVHLTTDVDPSLLGGAVTQIGSTIFDGSLRTQLHRLRRHMGQE